MNKHIQYENHMQFGLQPILLKNSNKLVRVFWLVLDYAFDLRDSNLIHVKTSIIEFYETN